MKAKLIECEICDSLLHLNHDMKRMIKRIVVDDIVITVDGNNIFVMGQQFIDKYISPHTVLGEIDVPDELVELARNYLEPKEKLHAKLEDFAELMK